MQFYGSSTRRRGPPGVTPRNRVAPLELRRSPRGGGAELGHGRGAPPPRPPRPLTPVSNPNCKRGLHLWAGTGARTPTAGGDPS